MRNQWGGINTCIFYFNALHRNYLLPALKLINCAIDFCSVLSISLREVTSDLTLRLAFGAYHDISVPVLFSPVTGLKTSVFKIIFIA